jgi:CheY-like chemotaxis protein
VREFADRAAIVLENARLAAEVGEEERRRNRFLAMLAHELRNPLAPISSAVRIIRGHEAPQAKVDWAADVIGRQAGHMARLVDGLLDVARFVQGKVTLKREHITLGAIIAGAAEAGAPLLRRRTQALAVEAAADAVVDGDLVRLVQAVTNLLDNASKFSPPDATVFLTADYADGEARISVRDTGAGIAPHFLPRVFDVFAQDEQSLHRPLGGLGLGLTLVRHVVELHGGRVVARSEGAGQGTEVVLHLPARPGAGAQPGTRPGVTVATRPVPRPGTSPVRVLVVDDEVVSAETLMTLLEIEGFEVRVAHDGTAALQAAGAFLPEVVLLDIGLPGMSGFEVAQRLRTDTASRDALLIALTGYGDEGARSRSAQAGFDAHMTKPAELRQLLAKLAEVRAARGAGARGTHHDP